MDAYDIFKKLSRGCIFPRKKELQAKKDALVETKIKTEHLEDVGEVEITETRSMLRNGEDNTLTLLGSMTSTESGKKTKKRKALKDETDIDKKRMLLEQEAINQYRNEQNIKVVGRHVAEPAKCFDDFNIKDDLKENLRKCGYIEPTPIQKQAIPIMLDKRQLLACAPTGSGKTAAFLVPLISELKGPEKKGFRALVICPTRELAKQTQSECYRLSEGRELRIHVITKMKQTQKQSQKFDILITTPNRLCHLLKQDVVDISLENIEWVVIDEADKLFEDGVRSFRDQMTVILAACTSTARKIAMFSATYTPAVAKWSVHNMKGLIRITIGHRNASSELVDQELLFVGHENGKLLAFRDLIRKGMMPPVLVFVQSKERAQQLFTELIYDGIHVDAIHADRTQSQRDNTVRAFREGKIWVLICTELMARGIDFKGVNLVVNYDFPPTAIAYVHRVGRAGRAGRKGKAITFFTLDDAVNLRSIAHVLKQSGCNVPDYMLTMKKHSKKERKRLAVSAPQRDDILTIPYDERRRIDKALGKNRLNLKKKVKVDAKNGKKNKKRGEIKKGDKIEKAKKIGKTVKSKAKNLVVKKKKTQ